MADNHIAILRDGRKVVVEMDPSVAVFIALCIDAASSKAPTMRSVAEDIRRTAIRASAQEAE